MEASRAVQPPRTRRSLRLAPQRAKPQADPAFEQLYKRHAREVYQYALALTANPADAEDVTQTTFLNAYRALERGERPHKPHNWLITITHNVCRMRWRHDGCRPKEVALDEAPEPIALEHDRPDLDEVLGALARLSFNQRAALVMRELEGRSYQEIADVLDVSVSAVEALLFRARRRLKVQRTALAAITSVPLPGSLSSFLGAGGGAAAAGGALLGADVILKAVAVVAAGVVTAGVGYKSVGAVSSTPPRGGVPLAQGAPQAKAQLASPSTQHQRRTLAAAHPVKGRKGKLRQASARAGAARSALAPAASSAMPPSGAAPLSPPAAVSTAAGTVPLPQLPPAPPPPAVTVPEIPPLPPLPPLTVTVTNPIPPPPPLK
jgi:RNA polymerase sigma factor (sigma-70 family)